MRARDHEVEHRAHPLVVARERRGDGVADGAGLATCSLQQLRGRADQAVDS
jgi:hypothetical protein